MGMKRVRQRGKKVYREGEGKGAGCRENIGRDTAANQKIFGNGREGNTRQLCQNRKANKREGKKKSDRKVEEKRSMRT